MDAGYDDTFTPMWRRILRDPLLSRVRAAEARGTAPTWWVEGGRIRAERPDGGTRPPGAPRAPITGLGPVELPIPANRFIGRAHESAEVAAAVAEQRLVTVTGPAGVGKTRLALEVASRLQDAFPDGVVCVDLAGVTDAALVAMEVATRLGLQEGTVGLTAGEQQDIPFVQRLAEKLAGRTLLIILETPGHLLGGCRAFLAALAAADATPHVLCTSGGPVGVPGERIVELRPLAVPARARPAIEDTLACDAVELFLDRSGLRGETPLTDEQVLVVGLICRRLQGVPYGIELAAKLAAGLPLEQILDRLDDLVDLSATVSQGYELLTPVQQLLLRRLSIFRGGFTTDAVVAVCADDDLDEPTVRATLDDLRAAGLLLDDAYLSVPRSSVVETARQFAAGLLARSGEEHRVRDAHRRHYLAFAVAAEPLLHGPDQVEALDAVELEHDNIRAALQVHDADAATDAVRILYALHRFFVVRGHLSEERAHIARILAVPTLTTPIRARALALSSRTALTFGDLEEAWSHAHAALTLARGTGDLIVEGIALGELGDVAFRTGRLARAEALLSECLAATRGTVGTGGFDGVRLSRVWLRLGSVARRRGDLHTARSHYVEALRLNRENNDLWGVVWALYWLGTLEVEHGRRETKELFDEGLSLSRRLGSRQATVLMLLGLGGSAYVRGDLTIAESNYSEALDVADGLEDETSRWVAVDGLIRTALAAGDLDSAQRWISEYERVASALPPNMVAEILSAKDELARRHRSLTEGGGTGSPSPFPARPSVASRAEGQPVLLRRPRSTAALALDVAGPLRAALPPPSRSDRGWYLDLGGDGTS